MAWGQEKGADFHISALRACQYEIFDFVPCSLPLKTLILLTFSCFLIRRRGKGRWLRLVRSADTVQAGTGFLIIANTPSHLTGTILRAACHGTTNLKAAAFEWLR